MAARWMAARASLGTAVLCLSPWGAVAHAQVAGAEVFEALRQKPRARVIVALREPDGPATSLARRAGEIDTIRSGVLSTLGPEDFVPTHQWESISAVAGDVSPSGLLALLHEPDVLQVDLDVPVYAALAESVSLVRADQVQNSGATGRGVVVAVLDSGVDGNHPDLRDNLAAEQCFCANADGSGCCPNGATSQSGAGAARDEQGHGTNVAGIITAAGNVSSRGVAPDSGLVAVRVLDRAGAAASTTQILSGLDYVMTQHPEVRVVNLSLATANLFSGPCDSAASFTTAFASSINALKSRGVVTVVSSGNNANSSQIAAPACITAALAVGAVYDGNVGTISFGCTDATTAADRVTCFSNSNSTVDLLAPGGAITSAGIGGGTSTFLGTSQAAPHVAGAAALLLSAKPGLTVDQVEQALKNTGVTITDPKNGLAFRRIDVQAALAAAP